MHLTPETWDKDCAFFHHPSQRKDPSYQVKIHRFARHLLPVQELTVWHALQELNGIAGSLFIGHVIGIGKTTIAFALHWIQNVFNCMWDQITKDLERYPDSHSPQGKGSTLLSACPTNEEMYHRFGFDCPCIPSSPTHFVKSRFGTTVALVPLGLLSVWVDEGAACFPPRSDGKAHPIQILKAHGQTAIPEATKKRLLGDETEYTRTEPDGQVHSADSNYSPRLRNSTVFVLTTSQSFQSKFLDIFRGRTEWIKHTPATTRTVRGGKEVVVPAKDTIRKNNWHNTAIVSMVIRDECHLETRDTSPSIRILRILQSYQEHFQIRIVPMSGTAITVGPKETTYWIQLMVRKCWSKDEVLQNWMGVECEDLGKRWDKLCTGRGDRTELVTMVTLFQPLVERLFIRFTNSSDFLGYQPSIVPKSLFRTIECDHAPDWTERIETLKEDEDMRLDLREIKRREAYSAQNKGNMAQYSPLQRNRPNMYGFARLCASFPYLMDLRHDGRRLRLTQSEWQDRVFYEKVWKPETSTDPYYNDLDKIIASSGKLKELGKLIERWDKVLDKEKKPARQIFCSYFHVGAYIIYLVSPNRKQCRMLQT
jgi:hypothetical protein